MGLEKSARIEADDNWLSKCQAENLRCSRCHLHPPYDERVTFFETGMCGYCAHQMAKDD